MYLPNYQNLSTIRKLTVKAKHALYVPFNSHLRNNSRKKLLKPKSEFLWAFIWHESETKSVVVGLPISLYIFFPAKIDLMK